MIHPLACIHDDVQIGEGASVWQFASVIRGARIGALCSIGSCAIVDGARLGDGVLVGHGASVNPGVRAGNSVFIGPNATLCNDRWPRADKEGFDLDLLLSGERWAVIIEAGAAIGAGAVVLPGVRIGEWAIIAAGAVCDRSVAPGHVFRRDGTTEPLRDGPQGRMRWAA